MRMRRLDPRTWVSLGALGLVGLAAAVAGYYVYHKPFGVDVLPAVGRLAADVLLSLALVSLAGGLGRRFIPSLLDEPLSDAALQLSLGLGSISLGILAVGLAGGLRAWVGWVALVALLILLHRDAADWLRSLGAVREALRQDGAFGKAIAFGSLVLLGTSLGEALAPPTRFDALVYHLTLPEAFLRQGSIAFDGANPYWGMPLGSEMLSTWALSVGRAQTATLLGWMVGAATVLGVLGVGRTLGRRVGWAAVAALLCGETLSASLGWGYADWPSALHGLGVLIALLVWAKKPNTRTAALAGVLVGWALGVKYTAGLLLPAGVAVLWVSAGPRQAWRSAMAFVGASCLAAAPWLAKNLVYTGLPLFPFVGPNPWVSSTAQGFYAGGAEAVSAIEALLTPVRATLLGREGGPGFAASIGPLMLGLVPGIFLVRKSSRAQVRAVAVLVVAGWIMWGLASWISFKLIQSRLYFVLFPSWALLAGSGFAGLARLRVAGVRFRRVASALILLVMVLAGSRALVQGVESRPLAAVLGVESEQAYLTRRLGAYAPAMAGVTELGERAHVLALWEARGLHCLPICHPDFWIDRWYLTWHALGDAERVLTYWREAGVTHVLFYRLGADFVRETDPRYDPESWRGLADVLTALHPVASFGDGYTLYQVPQ